MNAINALVSAIDRVREPRLFCTERGYQGQLAAQLDRLLDAEPSGITRPLVEEEYQKRAKVHGINLRPDIVVHIPFDRGVSPTRRHDNYLVVLLKFAARKTTADKDFEQLSIICSKLEYPIGAFLNIASTDLWLPGYTSTIGGGFTLYEFAITLKDSQPQIRTENRTFT
jgi:hypothetical protein